MSKTPITYYGGKLNLVSEILPLIPKHTVYIEPFFGGGAVFFAKPPSGAEVINDTNAMAINFYEVARSNFQELKTKIEGTLFSRASYTVALSIYRMPHLFSKLAQAWAFYVATNMGFSCKIGSWGFDKYSKRTKAFRNKKLIFDKTIVKRLENVQIEHLDALKVIVNRDDTDVVFYLDPPYPNSDQGHYSGYSMEDFERLLTVLGKIKGKFLLSSYPYEILEKYSKQYKWYTKTFEKPLSASNGANQKKRKRKLEVLTANYPI